MQDDGGGPAEIEKDAEKGGDDDEDEDGGDPDKVINSVDDCLSVLVRSVP